MNNFLENKHVITEILLSTLVPAGTGSITHKNRPSHGLALNMDGIKTYNFDGNNILTIRKNDILYLPKGSNYEVNSIMPGSVYCINFQILKDDNFMPFSIHVPNVDEILKCYQKSERAWTRSKDNREYKVFPELYKILCEIQALHTNPYVPQSKGAILKPAIDYIHKNYTNELINVQRLSKECNISYDYLRKLFKSVYGCSPIKYINNLKIKRAKELLSSGLYSVSETAFSSGFSDTSHFCRFFKENVGVLPSEFIK